MRKVIITAATTGGVHGKESNPNLPEQPKEIAQQAYESYNEGAAVVHVHARDKKGVSTGDPAVWKEIAGLIRPRCDMIIQFSTGGNMNMDDRLGCLEAEPEMASLNMGSLMRTIGPQAGTLFANPTAEIERFAQEMLKRNIKPEMEVYHHGMLREVDRLIGKGLVKKPYYINCVLGMAYQGAVAATPEALFSLKMLLPPDSLFNCCAIGAAQFPMTALSMLIGGNARVGMEDNIYYSRGVLAKNNAQLVARIVRITRELGLEIASPDEARKILGLSSSPG